MIEIPKFVYHATLKSNITSILEKGLLASDYEKVVYVCTNPIDAYIFMAIRGLSPIVVFKIATQLLDKNKFDKGYDHSPEFFKGIDVLTYSETIKPQNIAGIYQVGQEEK